MSPAQREQVRLSALRYCAAAGGIGVATALLYQAVRAEGIRMEPDQFREELRYLEQKTLLQRKPKLISPENELWQITALGRDFLARQGFE